MPELFGSYIVQEELGTGGMATVHLASGRTGPAYGKKVALKRLLPHTARVPELLASFIDEARLARYLKHPNIAQVYEFGRFSGTYFIAFEFVPGPTLEQLVNQCKLHVGPIPVPVVLNIGIQICDALDHAHTMRDEVGHHLGIVHRDVSPQNLIVSSSGFVKLIDFGLAKAKYQSVESQAGIIKGKLSYTAPEYIAGKLDARCDLWAVGVVLHEMLTGRRLFQTDDELSKVGRIQSMPIPRPSQLNAEVSRTLDDVVLTALERDPKRRWQTAAEMRTALVTHAQRQLSQAQLVQWVEWAFAQKKIEGMDSSISKLNEILDSGVLQEVEDSDDVVKLVKRLPNSSAAMLERRRESVAMMPMIGQGMLEQRRGASPAFWIGLLVFLVACAGGLLAYLKLRH
jgi:serine/threonine-protein kinase